MKDLKKQINKLSVAEKIVLVENIWNSIADSHYETLSVKEKTEFDSRVELIKNGKADFTSISQIKKKYNSLK